MMATLRLCAHCGGTLSHAASCPERGGYELADAPDPEAPNRTLRIVRKTDPLRALRWMEGRHWAAAERLRRAFAVAYGYREGLGEAVRVDSAVGGDHYIAEQMDALALLRDLAAGEIMPRRAWDVVQCVVIHDLPLDDTATELRMRRADVPRRLWAGLEALAAFPVDRREGFMAGIR